MRKRRTAPDVILAASGLSSPPVGLGVIRVTPVPLMTGFQLTLGDDWAVIDDSRKKHKGKVKATRESSVKIKINK